MFTLNCNGRLLVVDKPLVMGILNLTPDSFYAGSRHRGKEDILTTAEQMIHDGAAVLDLGGQSTRPGSERISAEEELQRVIPAIEMIHHEFPDCVISVDTFYAAVAREAVQAGASIVNDISGGSLDKEMISTVASLKVPYILMHMKGEPQTMQENPGYEDVTREVLDFFTWKKKELTENGIADVLIDPGFGFGKNISHNLKLLRDLEVFKMLDAPLVVGLSRKATICKLLGIKAGDALNGTTVLNTIALMNGALILRVHDVREANEAVKLFNAYKES